jgi:NAD(P)-dependent dehydrogenase (short-subunit alcohol dehydrogenase family)
VRRRDRAGAFRGRTAVVTGGASGIGRALGHALAARGARVVVADRDGAGAERVAAELGAAGTAATVDVTDDAAVGALVDRVVAAHGALDLMVNNAGISVGGDARDLTLDDWRGVLDVNLNGVVHGTRHALRVMAPQRSGHVVNMASAAGLLPFPTNVPYAASKHAVVGLSRSLRPEAAAYGVRVTAVCPSFVRTPILDSPLVGVDRAAAEVEIDRLRPLAPERAAELILGGVAANRALIVFPGYIRAMVLLDHVLPPVVRAYERSLVRRWNRMRQVG